MGRMFDPIDEDAPQPMRDLAERLRHLMDTARYGGVRELAAAAKLGRTTISLALSGSRAPTWQTVDAILRACSVRPDTAWLKAQELAKEAELQWKHAARSSSGPSGAAASMTELPASGASRPGLFSLRPPLGNLPVRIRGRGEVIDWLQRGLETRADRIQILCGLGGCGKTTIALGLARYAREHGYTVYWVSALVEDRLTTGMREIARELGAEDDEINDAWMGLTSAMDLVWRYLDAADVPWLLVIDNADVPDRLASDNGSPGDGTGWARPSARGMTVITSRVSSEDTWGHGAERHTVNVLGIDDGADVLIDLAGQAGTVEEARTLAARLDGLPLALRLAGSYLARASRGAGILRHQYRGYSGLRTFTAYTEALADMSTVLLDEGARHSVNDMQTESMHRQLVSRTWELSLDLLESQGLSESRMIMRLLSCFAATPFPVDCCRPRQYLIELTGLSRR
jgi:transcriptional regulator with XRE-family HTH domain